MSYITTFTNRKFYYDDIYNNDICIEDIAWSLSHQCRFAGHYPVFFSIAEHSIYVADMCKQSLIDHEECLVNKICLAALLHDAAEAYLCDIPSPLKELLPDYKNLYKEVEGLIELKFNIDIDHSIIKLCDKVAFSKERFDRKILLNKLSPNESFNLFMRKFREFNNE